MNATLITKLRGFCYNKPILCGVMFVILLRILQFPGSELQLDMDEAVVGLMAVHLLEGINIPIFFYGQSYGMTLLEASVTALHFSVFGHCAWAVRLAMLEIRVAGWILFALAMHRKFTSLMIPLSGFGSRTPPLCRQSIARYMIRS